MFGFWKGTKAKLLPSTGIEFSDGRFYTYGSGSPEGVVTATIGSFYSDTANGFLYTKNSGAGDTGWVLSASTGSVPTGTVIESAATSAPTDFLECDGSAISRTTYASLFAAISTTYGTGDGSTTFNIPDRRGNVGRGAGTSVGYTQNVTIAQGAKTDDAFQGHYHEFYSSSDGGNLGSARESVQNTTNLQTNTVRSAITDGTNGTPRTANETRVKSLGMKYFIKF